MVRVPSVAVVFGLRNADAAHVQVVVAPEETYGPGLQHVHIVFPVKLHSFHFPDVVRVGDYEAPARPVLHSLVTAVRNKKKSLRSERRNDNAQCRPQNNVRRSIVITNFRETRVLFLRRIRERDDFYFFFFVFVHSNAFKVYHW